MLKGPEYRLSGRPFELASWAVGLIFLLYLVGALTAVVAGRLADSRGRALVLGITLPITVIGLLATVPQALVAIVIGAGVFTGGFFSAHTVASGWAGAVARQHRAEASALSLFATTWPAHSAASPTLSAAGRPPWCSSVRRCWHRYCSRRCWCEKLSQRSD